MKNRNISNFLLGVFKRSVLAFVAIAGFAICNSQALTTTLTYELGSEGNGTSIGALSVLSPAWIPVGSLPVGSILRSVSIAARLDTEGGGDSFANDLFVYFDPAAPPSGNEILQIGGFDALGAPVTRLSWSNGGTGTLGATVTGSKSAVADFPSTIDLNATGVYLGSRGIIPASWSGTVSVEYDVFVPAAIRSFGPGATISNLVDNAADIVWAVPPGTDITALAPTFTLTSGSSDRESGGPATYDFTNPVVYTVTDGGIINTYSVTVTISDFLLWNVAGDGNWDLTTPNWLSQPSATQTTFANGIEVVFNNDAGGAITSDPGMLPLSITVGGTGIYTFAGGPITSEGLTVSAPGTLDLSAANTYAGPISGDGTMRRPLGVGLNQPLNHDLSEFTGTFELIGGQVSINPFFSPSFVSPTNGTIRVGNNTTLYLGWQNMTLDTTVALDGGVDNGENLGVLRGDGATLNGVVILGTDSSIGSAGGVFTINAVIGDEGEGYGFTKRGTGTVVLAGENTYSGPTSVALGTLRCDSPDSLGGGDLSISGGVVNLNYSGTKAIVSLTLGGVPQAANGTYGSAASGADFQSTRFSGTGTVTLGDPAMAAFITSFGTNVPGSFAVISPVDTNIATVSWTVPGGTDLATLAPEFVLSTGATMTDQTSGAIPSPGFDAGPVAYNVASSNGLVTNVYTVSVTVLPLETSLIWDLAGGGEWDFSSPNWKGKSSGLVVPFFDGVDVSFNNPEGGLIEITPSVSPLSTTVSGTGVYIFAGGPIASGELIVSAPVTLNLSAADTYNGPVSGDGTVRRVLGGTANQPLNYDMSAFTGTLELSTGMASATPFHSPSFVGPTGGAIRIENNTTLYLGWQGMTLDSTVRLDGSVDNGEGLGVLRGDTATLNGAVVLGTDSSIGSAGGTFTVNAVISDGGSGYGFTKRGGGTVVLTAANTYGGPTGVAAGTLRLDSPDALSGGALSISGGVANLNYSGTKAVVSLTLGGEQQTTAGTYGSADSGADFQSAYFAGSGTVTIGAGSAYDTWAAGPFLGTLTDPTQSVDLDGGGLATGIEWVVGGDPTDPSDDAGLAPTGTLDPSGTYFVFTYRRTHAAKNDPKTTIKVEYSTDLQGAWTDVSAAPGVLTSAVPVADKDSVEVLIPMSLASPGTKLFARLNVVVVP